MKPMTSFSGLASGIQWRDLIDQLVQVERTRRVNPIQNRLTEQEKRVDAWKSYEGLVRKLSSAARALDDGSAFNQFGVTVGPSATTQRALLSATASELAQPGNYKVEVLGLARAEKLSGRVETSATDALGLAAGDFLINGKLIQVTSADSLNTVRDKINTAGAGVTATVLSTASNAHRLVLTSDHAGSAGIDLVEGASGALQSLGVVDGTRSVNTTGDGGARTQRFSAVTSTIAAMLGVTMPPPATIKVGGKTITVDLSVDSLSSIVAKIQAEGVSAKTVEETVGGKTTYRAEVSGSVSADTADGQRALDLLGLTQQGRGAVQHTLLTDTALKSGGAAITTADTKLVNLDGGVVAGDTFSIRGSRADGTSVDATFTVADGNTSVQDLLNELSTRFSTATRPVSATLQGGRITLTDTNGGDSRLNLSLVANNQGGGTLNFGRAEVQTVGRLREVVAGSDAQARVDGVLIERQSNVISEAIQGVTLSLQQAEPGTTVDVTVARDQEASINAFKEFVAAYNEVQDFLAKQGKSGSPLYVNGVLRTTSAQIKEVLLSTPATLPPGSKYERPSLVGLSHSRTGQLELNEETLRSAIQSNLEDVRALFGADGIGGALRSVTDRITRSGDGVVALQIESLNASNTTLSRRIDDAEARVELRRQMWVQQFSRMEEVMGRFKSQGDWLSAQIQAMQPRRQ